MEIYPILNKPGKGKYVFIFILNERAVLIYYPVFRQFLLHRIFDGVFIDLILLPLASL